MSGIVWGANPCISCAGSFTRSSRGLGPRARWSGACLSLAQGARATIVCLHLKSFTRRVCHDQGPRTGRMRDQVRMATAILQARDMGVRVASTGTWVSGWWPGGQGHGCEV
eukprot:6945260-Lingulodinium_polyedra.AAC.1